MSTPCSTNSHPEQNQTSPATVTLSCSSPAKKCSSQYRSGSPAQTPWILLYLLTSTLLFDLRPALGPPVVSTRAVGGLIVMCYPGIDTDGGAGWEGASCKVCAKGWNETYQGEPHIWVHSQCFFDYCLEISEFLSLVECDSVREPAFCGGCVNLGL